MSDIDIVESALLSEFLRVPFVHKGRDLSGADCYGIIILWYEMRMGKKLLDPFNDYPEGPAWRDKSIFIENYHMQWDKVDDPKKYDVVLFKAQSGEIVNHAGIFLGKNKFIHTTKKTGCIIQRLDHMSDRIDGFYRLKQ